VKGNLEVYVRAEGPRGAGKTRILDKIRAILTDEGFYTEGPKEVESFTWEVLTAQKEETR
jgi:hypothetical protein